jgi:hypothetical protein
MTMEIAAFGTLSSVDMSFMRGCPILEGPEIRSTVFVLLSQLALATCV